MAVNAPSMLQGRNAFVPSDIKEQIRRFSLKLGFSSCGFTTAATPSTHHFFTAWLEMGGQAGMGWLERGREKRADLRRVLPGVQSVVVLAASYHDPGGASMGRALDGMLARYARYADYHQIMGERLAQIALLLRELGGAHVQSLWYVDTGPVLERDLAQRAGVGFIGKHTNLVGTHHGNWLLLGEVLTTLALEPDPPERSRCGTCKRCMQACPTQAITHPYVLDARRCLAYLSIEHKEAIPLEFREAMGNRVFGCDDCLAVCPWNRFAQAAQLMRSGARPALNHLDLRECLALNAGEFKQRFGGTPVERLKWNRFMRNVCVAAGNTHHMEYLPLLRALRDSGDALVVEHAAWAVKRIEAALPPS